MASKLCFVYTLLAQPCFVYLILTDRKFKSILFLGAGNYVRDDVIFNTIQLVSESADLQPYVVHESWKAIRDTQNCTEKQPLTQVSCWCIGEYGAALLNGVSVEGETLTVSEQEVIDVYQKIVWAKHMSLITKQYAVMSVTKLSTRFPNATPKIQEIIDAFSCHMDIDLQQRGVEFSQLFRKHQNLRSALLEPMPPIEREVSQTNGGSGVIETIPDQSNESLLGGGDLGISIIGDNAGANNDSLLDLIDNSVPISSIPSSVAPVKSGQDSLLDLLDLDLGSAPVNNPIPAQSIPAANILDGLDNLVVNNTLNGFIPKLVGYNKNNISITFHFDRPTPSGLCVMNLSIVNGASEAVSEFYLQAAVPKSMQLEILPASSTAIEPNGGTVSQVLKVTNPNKAAVKMRLKVSFSRGGQQFLDQGEVSGFPAELNNY